MGEAAGREAELQGRRALSKPLVSCIGVQPRSWLDSNTICGARHGKPDIWFFGDFTSAFIEHWHFARGTYKLLWVLGISLEGKMISGAHVVIYSKDAEADRAFFRDVLGFKSVDAGHGWLIFGLPPGEVAFHPSGENGLHELYFMCDGLKAEMASLAKKGVECSEVQEARWGSITKMRLPSGGEVGLYQPKHPTALASD